MPTPEIIARVRELHDELDARPDLAQRAGVDELKQSLQTVIREPTHAPHYKSLSDRLTFHYVGFQLEHPQLAGAMQAIVDSLAAAGI